MHPFSIYFTGIKIESKYRKYRKNRKNRERKVIPCSGLGKPTLVTTKTNREGKGESALNYTSTLELAS